MQVFVLVALGPLTLGSVEDFKSFWLTKGKVWPVWCYPPLWLSLDMGNRAVCTRSLLVVGNLWFSLFSGSEGIYPLVITATVETLKAGCLSGLSRVWIPSMLSSSVSIVLILFLCRFWRRKTGTRSFTMAWPPPHPGLLSTSSLSWHLGTMFSLICWWPSW